MRREFERHGELQRGMRWVVRLVTNHLAASAGRAVICLNSKCDFFRLPGGNDDLRDIRATAIALVCQYEPPGANVSYRKRCTQFLANGDGPKVPLKIVDNRDGSLGLVIRQSSGPAITF